MSKWEVTLEAHGLATRTVEADTADEAEAKALAATVGFIVEGGSVSWETISVWAADE